MTTVKAECSACSGSGIYRGMAEPVGMGVVRLRCDGSGCANLNYTPFSGRKRRDGIQEVRRSKGSFIMGCGPTGDSVAYADFLAGIMPPEEPSQ
jgi:hypothetical protein